ncbi:MAG: PEP-CTERM sorting domain-containing protein [Methylomarinum sp.]|nr:PEP-CTERM sorting domain-containing protein [Methylomarinum sp.]
MNKRSYFTVFLTLILSWGFYIPHTHAASIQLNILDGNIEVGETFDIEVWVDGEGIGEDLLTFGFDVISPDTIFSYTGYTIGTGFDDFSDPFNPFNVSGDAFPGIADNDVLLATLTFSANNFGIDSLSVEGANDGFFYGLFYEFSDGDISASTNILINPSSTVPEPGSFALMTIGLAGLLRGSRRKKVI